jgi:DnaJ-class molecular chaperone
MGDRDLYSVLGVSRNAETTEIRSAYKQLAKEHHPDKGGDPEKFKELSQAHEVLSDDNRRRMYDMTGNASEQQQGGGFPGGMPFGMGGGMPFGMGGMGGGMPDIFAQMFGGGGFPGGPGGGPNRKREGKSPGKTQDLPLRISDYYHGRQLSVKLGRQVFCKDCKGSGAVSTRRCEDCGGQGSIKQMVNMGPVQMVGHAPCNACMGKGQKSTGQCNGCQGKCLLPEEKTLDIKIEPGMMSGNTVVFSGMCSDHPSFTEAGDVTVVLREADEEGMASSWKREASKLKTSITLNLTESLLGTTRVLMGHPGFPGGVPIEIPPGTQNMWTGTIPGLGMPIRGTPRFGEAYVSVLVIPTAEETNALRSNLIMLKSLMPALPPVPECNESARSGRWAAI